MCLALPSKARTWARRSELEISIAPRLMTFCTRGRVLRTSRSSARVRLSSVRRRSAFCWGGVPTDRSGVSWGWGANGSDKCFLGIGHRRGLQY
eukprot:856764-Lingulodinium_polyedra.AAC.1